MMQLRAPVLATQRIAVRCLLTTRAHIAPLYRQSTLHAHANTAKLHQQRSLLCSAAEPQVQGRCTSLTGVQSEHMRLNGT